MTKHSMDRINGRMKEVGVSVDTAHLSKLRQALPHGKHYVRIVDLGRHMRTSDGSNGDTVVAIVNTGNVVTVMLSNNWQRWQDGKFHVALQD